MFIDWLTVSQEFDFDLPVFSDTAFLAIDLNTNEILSTSYRALTHEGSYSSTLKIRINGRKITVDGNPSRINRHDNLWGFETVDCSGQLIPDTSLSFSSATAGAKPSLN